ncbi:MAG: hypothetical protein HY708_03435 [Ignavibacteriae bacterium]|nr:hypothetical protein [Ignavibacteriota bacterium]
MTLTDLTGSTILGIAVIAAILGLNFFLADSAQKFTSDLTTQQTAVDFTRTLQWDMDKIGYRDTTGHPVLVAKTDTLMFLGDVDDSDTIRTVKYFLDSNPARTSTSNPSDFLLYRIILPSDTTKLNVGLTKFQLTYFDSTGNTTTNPQIVRGIRVRAQIEGPDVQIDSTYSGLYWENTFYPRNINLPR